MNEPLRDISSLIDLDRLMLFARTLVTPLIGVTNSLATSVQGVLSAVDDLDARVDAVENRQFTFSVDFTTGNLLWDDTAGLVFSVNPSTGHLVWEEGTNE